TLHPDLVRELEPQGVNPGSVRLCRDLRQLFDEHIEAVLKLESVREEILHGAYPQLDLEERLPDLLQEELAWKELNPEDLGFPPEFENPHTSPRSSRSTTF